MDELAAFLRARLDEDEAAAKAATPGPWILAEDREWLNRNVVFGEGSWAGHIQQVCNVDYAEHKEGNLAHIARHDPARALREVEAGRRLLAEYERLLKNQEHHAAALDEWKADVEHEERAGQWAGAGNPGSRSLALGREGDLLGAMIPILRALIAAHAAVYDRHPDYRQEWAFPRS